MTCSENKWVNAAWRRENTKEEISTVEETMKTMEDVEVEIQSEGDTICTDGELIHGKPAWKRLKEKLKKGVENQRVEEYRMKEQQSKLYREQEQECHVLLYQNLSPRKTAAIMTLLQEMVETRSWKEARGLTDDSSCRICSQHSETVEHLVAGCTKLAKNKYLTRHNQTLMILAVAWEKQKELVRQEAIWYEQRWDRGTVLENDKAKGVWDFIKGIKALKVVLKKIFDNSNLLEEVVAVMQKIVLTDSKSIVRRVMSWSHPRVSPL